MKALGKLTKNVGLTLYETAEPVTGPNDVKIKIHKTAICGTDIHIYQWDDWAQKTIPVPMTIGHEFVGEIVEIGSEVSGLSIGQRASGEGHITCGHCRNCRAGARHLCRNTQGIGVNRTGAFAEYLVMPASNVFVVPDGIDSNIAAIFDPLGNSVHTALSFNCVGEDVLITGAGPTGIMAASIAKHIGARYVVVTDINEYRLKLARKSGATLAVNVLDTSLESVMQQLGMTEGFDIGMEMSGNSNAFSNMINYMNHGGKIALLGIMPDVAAVDWTKIVFKGLTIKGIYGREMFETWYKMVSMLQSGLDVSHVITHQFTIDKFQKGFDMILSGKSGKVILNWP